MIVSQKIGTKLNVIQQPTTLSCKPVKFTTDTHPEPALKTGQNFKKNDEYQPNDGKF